MSAGTSPSPWEGSVRHLRRATTHCSYGPFVISHLRAADRDGTGRRRTPRGQVTGHLALTRKLGNGSDPLRRPGAGDRRQFVRCLRGRLERDAAAPTTERVVFRKAGDVVHAIREGEPGAAVVVTADFDRALALFKELTGTGGQ